MEFNQSILTKKGRTLMAKAISGRANIVFTKMQSSSTQYQMTQLEMLTSLSNVKQRADVVAEKNNGVTVKVKGTFDNYNLNSGYDFRTVGLYANDPDEGEILYSVSTASVSGYMPPNTGISATGIDITFYVEVGNADKVNLEIDPAGFATKAELRALEVNVAYSNSYDGMVDFSKAKPKENIFTSSLIKWKNNINYDNDVFIMSTLTREDIINIGFQFYTSGNQYIKESNITNVKLGRLGIKLNVPENANYVRMYITNELRTTSSALDIFVDKLINKTITISFDLSVNSEKKYLYSKFKISEDEIVFYLPNKAVNYRDSFMKYIGHSIKESTNPIDYKWQVNPEWQRAQIEYEKASIIQDKLVNIVKPFTEENTPIIDNVNNEWRFNPVLESKSVSNGIIDIVKKSINDGTIFSKYPMQPNQIYYSAIDYKSSESGGNIILDNRNIRIINDTLSDWKTYSDYISLSLAKGDPLIRYYTNGNKSYSLKNPRVYNVTEIFGAGNEPTLEEFERLLSINVNRPAIYSQSITQAKLNAHPINSLYYTESAESPETTFGGKWSKLGTEAKFSKTFNVWQRTQ